jgi:hypothetical protein
MILKTFAKRISPCRGMKTLMVKLISLEEYTHLNVCLSVKVVFKEFLNKVMCIDVLLKAQLSFGTKSDL